jgi:hypothetical protein
MRRDGGEERGRGVRGAGRPQSPRCVAMRRKRNWALKLQHPISSLTLSADPTGFKFPTNILPTLPYIWRRHHRTAQHPGAARSSGLQSTRFRAVAMDM